MRRVYLITGAAGRLGNALCRALLPMHEVVAVYHQRIPDIPSQLCSPAGDASPRAWCVQADLTIRSDLRRLVEVAIARHGAVDVLVNAAADLRFHGSLLEMSYGPEQEEAQLRLNALAPSELASLLFQSCWKHEREQNTVRNRCVVNVSSGSGLYVFPGSGQAAYGASKAALNFLTLHLASEMAPYGVRANVICPAAFPEAVATGKVVEQTIALAEGRETGEILELFS